MKALLALTAFLSALSLPAAETIWLDSLDLSSMQQGWGTPQANRAVNGQPLSIGGKKFARGVGTHSYSSYRLLLKGGTERFSASVGVDDAAGGPGTVIFQISADGRIAFNSGIMRLGQPAKTVDVDLRGVRAILLSVRTAYDGISFDHANWADARFTVTGLKPIPITTPPEAPYLLTPKPSAAPRLNGPTVYGARPGHPFLYRIPAQGERPMRFSASGLPSGLQLNSDTGIVQGTTPARGEYIVTVCAANRHGQSRRILRIISGDTLSLTPEMGWNHWYAHYDRIDDAMIREAAAALIATGMADVGYQYVNIDDCWMNAASPRVPDPLRSGALRDEDGAVKSNGHFPDMRRLTDYIHAKGLKAGIYTSPGPKTCDGGVGAYGHEAQDAKRFADWGFDFLKYDWCHYRDVVGPSPSLAEMKRPYQIMGSLLRQQPRDIVFNLCQYGMGEVWKWGPEVGGQSWRTGFDLGYELDWIFEVALRNCAYRAWQHPGAWNDPDYLQIGQISSAQTTGPAGPCPFTPTEQYSFMSLWALMASPLIYGGDIAKLDEFTLNILCNPEVIAVDQDPLGKCARVVMLNDDIFLLVKDMEDGAKAVGLCNRGEAKVDVTARWGDLGVEGRQSVRDVWRQKNLGEFVADFKAEVPRHGVMLIKIAPSGRSMPLVMQ